MKGIFKGIITIAIGGTIFTFSQTDLVKNFSKETGLSQKEAQQYVENLSEDDMVSFDKLGSNFVSDGQSVLSVARDIDCDNYTYEWETYTLSCEEGKSQLVRLGNDEISLGKAYTILASDAATKEDMFSVINLIDRNNTDLSLEIVSNILDPKTIDDTRKTNSFNKSLIQSALESR